MPGQMASLLADRAAAMTAASSETAALNGRAWLGAVADVTQRAGMMRQQALLSWYYNTQSTSLECFSRAACSWSYHRGSMMYDAWDPCNIMCSIIPCKPPCVPSKRPTASAIIIAIIGFADTTDSDWGAHLLPAAKQPRQTMCACNTGADGEKLDVQVPALICLHCMRASGASAAEPNRP